MDSFASNVGLVEALCYPLVMTNKAMENGPFIGDLAIRIVIFRGYVKLAEGKSIYIRVLSNIKHD